MTSDQMYEALAIAVMAFHVIVIAFNVGGLVAIIAGGLLRRAWIRNLAFRLTHLGVVVVVVVTKWIGEACSLTALEQWLRSQAHQTTYAGGFIQHWLGRILYLDVPMWVFGVVYTLFGVAVVASWFAFPPVRRKRAAKP